MPYYREREHFSIVIKIFLKTVVRMSSTQFDFNVLFIFLRVRRVYLGVFGASVVLEKITRKGLRLIERTVHIIVELFCESIAVIDSEDTLIDVDIDCDIEILPGIVVRKISNNFRNFLPLKENTLRNP